MATANFSLNLSHKGAAFIWGSLQDASPMQFVYQAAPYVVTNNPPPTKYEYTSQGWLKKIVGAEGTVTINYDDVGNRTSVVTSL